MNAQLLLLLALAGPFCAFTRASPTIIPTDPDALVTQTEEASIFHATEFPHGYTVITSPPPMEPEPVTQELPSEAVTEAVHRELTTDTVTEAVHQELTTDAVTEAVHQELPTEAGTLAAVVTEQTSAETEEAEMELLLSTHASTPEPAAPTEEVEVAQTSVTAAARTETNSGVIIEEDAVAEGLTSGQAAGIAIGILIAIAFVIAIAITVARRMGKYSP